MKLQYYKVVNVVIHILKSKGVPEMMNKTNKIKKKGGFLRLQVLRFITSIHTVRFQCSP